MTEVKFFLYGSLTEGLVHFERIRDFIVDQKEASIKAKAYRLKVGFPVLLKEGEDSVPGAVVTVKSPDLLIHLLDEFHGFRPQEPQKSLYFKELVEVTDVNGQTDVVYTYFLNPKHLPSSASLIVGGDWKRALGSVPLFTATLTDRQKHYINKLGKVSGREIIPIDLPLYRELMNLEIIVDKGRRLALSKFGNEVFRYLN
ncbi:MAG: gamma-glutamylcyclotransferase [Pseudobdellovibrionaceae bacterium]